MSSEKLIGKGTRKDPFKVPQTEAGWTSVRMQAWCAEEAAVVWSAFNPNGIKNPACVLEPGQPNHKSEGCPYRMQWNKGADSAAPPDVLKEDTALQLTTVASCQRCLEMSEDPNRRQCFLHAEYRRTQTRKTGK